MKKYSSTLVAAAASAGMLIGAGIATAQVPAPVPSDCPAGQHFENVGGTFKCVENAETPQPEKPSNDGIPPAVDNSATCPDGSPRDMGKKDPVTGIFGACGTGEDSKPAPKPEEEKPSNDGIPPAVDDTANCPDGSPCDMGRKDPKTGVFGYCAPSEDEDKPGDDKPGEDDKKPGEEKPGDKSDDSKKDENKDGKKDNKKVVKKTDSKGNGLAVTGVQATALGGAALALLVGGVAATRYARKNSKDD